MSITPANIRTGLLLVILCLAGAGCVHYDTPAKRAASFAPYQAAKVGKEILREYLVDRSGFLLRTESLDLTLLGTNTLHYSGRLGHGTAAAIDQRGYFLTAAHCVEKGQIWLGFLREGKFQVERARIVWRGDEKKREPDLAVLCVSQPIGQTFQWAAEFTNGSPVMDMGLRIDDHPRHVQPQYMAGRVSQVTNALSTNSLAYSVVSHSSPLRPGDSGGPVVLSDGRLVGINVSVEHGFQWSRLSFTPLHSTAHRPDLAWLRKVIDADVALQSVSGPKTKRMHRTPRLQRYSIQASWARRR